YRSSSARTTDRAVLSQNRRSRSCRRRCVMRDESTASQMSVADELVALQLLAQGAAVDAEDLRRTALIALRVIQHRLVQRLLDLADDELVQIARFVSVEAFEIALQCFVRERAERFYSS